jgi:DNA (cytosine-5)-methyltransferase 1
MPRPKIIDLFAGAGGFSVGAHLAGFSPALAIEVDRNLGYSRGVNFPGSKTLYADIATVDPAFALLKANIKPGELSGIIGGPPCQGFSEMGRRDPLDERNSLVRRFFDYVVELAPPFFLFENVPGILDPELRFHLDDGLDRTAGMYELVGPIVLDAKNFGAATTRERVVVLGYRRDRMGGVSEEEIHAVEVEPSKVVDAIADVPPPQDIDWDTAGNAWGQYDPELRPLARYARRARKAPPKGLGTTQIREAVRGARVSGVQPTRHTPLVLARFASLEPGQVDAISKYPRLRWDGICTTLRAGTGRDRGSFQAARPIHPSEHRVITVREAARIQGFPDWFQFHPTIWHSFRMIGNSVSPYLSEALLKLIRSKLDQAPEGHPAEQAPE